MSKPSLLRRLSGVASCCLSLLIVAHPALAHEGHDHGPPPPPITSQPLAPRVYAQTAAFELVGILESGELRLWLDDFATNRPVEDAAIEVEGGGIQAVAAHRGGALYVMPAGPLEQPGRHDLLFTITTPRAADLLLGALETPAPSPASPALSGAATPEWFDSPRLLQGVVAVLALWVLLLLARRDRRGGGSGSAVLLALLCSLPLVVRPAPALAHGGEDHSHGEAPPAVASIASGAAATRLPDGSLFVPKPVQHLMGLRTASAEAGEWRDSFTLNGHVIADPGAGGLVQAPLRGRVVLVDAGLPLLGQRVEAGQVLAWLEPILDAVDHTTLQAELADIDGKRTIAARNRERLTRLGANASRQEIDDSEAELAGLNGRHRAITDGFRERRPLAAPVAGVIASIDASPGRIVEGGQTLFTLVDPERLWVEGLLYDTAHATHFVAASGRLADGTALALTPMGGAYALRGHALPVQFRIDLPAAGNPSHLTLGQPVEVFAEAWHTQKGLRIPTPAIQKGVDGAGLVWVHAQAETFRPVRVQARPLDGAHSVVADAITAVGLAAGDRVVVQGAALLGQVR